MDKHMENTQSKAERSADEWAATGRKAANLAMDETGKNYQAVEQHLETAKLCFEMEQKLRKMLMTHD
jgi:hypothetical protein